LFILLIDFNLAHASNRNYRLKARLYMSVCVCVCVCPQWGAYAWGWSQMSWAMYAFVDHLFGCVLYEFYSEQETTRRWSEV